MYRTIDINGELHLVTSMTPSIVLTATSGNVTVTSKLYGPADAARVEREKRAVAHRAEQLNLTRIERIKRDDSRE